MRAGALPKNGERGPIQVRVMGPNCRRVPTVHGDRVDGVQSRCCEGAFIFSATIRKAPAFAPIWHAAGMTT